MKKQNVSLLVFLLATSGFFFSCGNIMNKNTGALKFDSIAVNETTHLFGDTAKPSSNLIINFTYATQSSDVKLKDSLNSFFLSLCFGDKYRTLTPQEAVEKYKETYVTNYRNDLEPMYKKDEQEPENKESMLSWYSYYKTIESQVQFYQKDLLVYRTHYDEFTGGAHGVYNTTFLNIDLNSLEPIRLEDLFIPDYKEALTDLLWNQLMADNHVTTHQELEDMGYATTGDLEPTENFYLNEEGITFYYNIYDITPYVMGPVKISLPYEAVQRILNKDNSVLNKVRK